MKTADIKVGEDYAYFAYKHSNAERVTVTATGVAQQGSRHYYGRGPTTKSGVTFTFVNGSRKGQSMTARAQTIVRPWAEQQVIEDNAREARKQRDDYARATAARRAATAARIEAVLEAHGEPVATYLPTFWSQKVHLDALVAVGFKIGKSSYGDRDAIVTRITGLDDFMVKGTLPEKVIEVLLADSTVTA